MQLTQGTPAYMPPELVLGSGLGSSPQAIDIFGVGVVLHDLAHLGITAPRQPPSLAAPPSTPCASQPTQDSGAGRGPLRGLVARHAAGFKVDVGAHCPAALAAIILRCMSAQPAGRPLSGEVLTSMLKIAAEAADAAARRLPWT